MATPPPRELPTNDINHRGFTRFELELEFVQMLGNAIYLNHLAMQKMFDKPEFVAYIEYLQYWRKPEYVKYLSYPGPTLRALELLQQESFRTDILRPDVMERLMREGLTAVVDMPATTAG